MRIDGMDAAAVNYSGTQESGSNTPVKENITKDNQAETIEKNKVNASIDTVNISQLTALEKQELPIAEKTVINAIERANKAISGANTKFEFSIHQKTKQIMVKVIDSDTGDVIREIPPEKTLDMVAKMWEMAGIVVDERR